MRRLRQCSKLDAPVICPGIKGASLAGWCLFKTMFSRPPTPDHLSISREFQDGIQPGAGDKVAARGTRERVQQIELRQADRVVLDNREVCGYLMDGFK